MIKIKIICLLCLSCFLFSCDYSSDAEEDHEASLKRIKIINSTDKTLTVYRIREKNGVPEQRADAVTPGNFIYISVQYKIHIDGQFSAVYNGLVHVYDADISSGEEQFITIETGDFL